MIDDVAGDPRRAKSDGDRPVSGAAGGHEPASTALCERIEGYNRSAVVIDDPSASTTEGHGLPFCPRKPKPQRCRARAKRLFPLTDQKPKVPLDQTVILNFQTHPMPPNLN
jgi:hypothetical protein